MSVTEEKDSAVSIVRLSDQDSGLPSASWLAGQLGARFRELLLLLQRYVARHGHRMLQANGTLNDLFVSFREAGALLSDETAFSASEALAEEIGWPSEELIERQLSECRIGLGKTAAVETEATAHGTLESLRRRFRLTGRQLRLLVAAAAPSISVDLARLYSFAWADFSQKVPTTGFLAELVADTPEEIPVLLNEFRGSGALVLSRLIVLSDSQAWGVPTPLLHQSVRVPERIVAHLLGQTEPLATQLADTCVLSPPEEAVPRDLLVVDPSVLADLELAVDLALSDTSSAPRPLLIGAPESGRRTTLHTLLAERGWGLLTVDLLRLSREEHEIETLLRQACREALLRRCLLLVRGELLVANREEMERWARHLTRVVNPYPGPLAITVTRPEARLHGFLSKLFEVVFPLPSSAQQRTLWARVLAENRCDIRADAPEILTQRFNVTPGTIYRTVAEARSRAMLLFGTTERTELRVVDLSYAIRRKTDHALGAIAEPFNTTLTWDDVVLPEKVFKVLHEIQGYARHRETVYDDWGFRKKISYGRGLSCLFSGPPGTGKTMMSAVLAESLGRELYRVDLSRIVSKWVGETEKNLALAFDEAERGQLVLLFDEADSLFSKRTSQKTSNDRFANMEITYLLQRMEAFDGMSILTTNKEKSIDEAFKRRLKFKVSFPMPEPALRAQLWEKMLPPEASIADDIDYRWLGEQFELAGGSIRNATLRAAFYAPETDGIINHDLLYQAALAEAREMGMVVRDEGM